jgi:hypothetical protein
MSNEINKKLDEYFVNFVSDPNFPAFMKGFFGQDKIWVKNTLKAVLPENTSDEILTNAAARLFEYKTKNELIFKKIKSQEIEDFFRDMYDK